MEQDAKQRLLVLLQQLKLTDDSYLPFFEDGELTRLTIHKGQRLWRFAITVPNILPYSVYELIQLRMHETFSHIANIHVTFEARNQAYTTELIHQYWQTVVANTAGITSFLQERLVMHLPKVEGNKLMITCREEAECVMLQKKYEPLLNDSFAMCGFPRMKIDFMVSDDTTDIEALEQERLALEQERQALEEEASARIAKHLDERKQHSEEETFTGPIQIGRPIKDEPTPMDLIIEDEKWVTIEGAVFDIELRELRSGKKILQMKMTDYTNSFLVKKFTNGAEEDAMLASIKKGMWVKVAGPAITDDYSHELVIMARAIMEVAHEPRQDTAPHKRVELHLHTQMSQMDAVTPVGDLVAQAAKWGHNAIAVTDHAVVQAFPDAYAAGKKNGIKVIYGLEANLVDDGVQIVYNEAHRLVEEDTYVVFDVETTGLSSTYDTIIELAAIKIKDGEEIGRFERFCNPHHPLSAITTELTGITDAMVQNAPEVEDVIREFHTFIGDAVTVAHNASFDMGFLYAAYRKYDIATTKHPTIDTLELSRMLYPTLKSHRLNTLCKRFNIELTQHHRAIYDTEATVQLFLHLINDAMKEKEIRYLDDFNEHIVSSEAYKRARPSHCTILAQNAVGLKNLFKLVSIAHTETFYRVPRLRRSTIEKFREGLIIGSGCDKGEVFEAAMQRSLEEAEDAAKFYDYLEVHPPAVYSQLIDGGIVHSYDNLHDIIRKIVRIGKKLDKPVVATGNVHYLNEEDAKYRQILIGSQGGANPLNRQKLPQVHFRTTNEMLEAFDFLTPTDAEAIVVTNTQKIADSIEEVKPIKDDLYTPKIEGSDEEVTKLTYEMARAIYGETLPDIVTARIEKELKSILGHGFGVIYLISAKLVKKSLADGYLVGSRGSVGSSLVATFMEITEVNPLPPHYICPNCQHSYFFTDGSVSSGYDLPNKDCEKCGTPYKKDGQDIPFETFLGFKGDKVPDIDLNFSGEYQPEAHNYTKVLFGEDYVFRAGTIGTVAEKTAYGYVKGYASDHNLQYRAAEVDRLVQGCTGVKRTTGQHPGGIIVVPDYMDIYDFSPVQFPADAQDSEWKTTHFDFHSIHDNILKLDILGHDDPTVIRMLQDLSGIDPKTIPTDDPEVMRIFSSPESLGVTEEQINCKTGTLGIPEFGTRFVRQMLESTKPSTFSELVQISGLSHGTDVWLGNAQTLIEEGTCVLSEVIGCRDDIMVYLIYQGLEPSLAFNIMEFVRKGRGLTPEFEEEMKKNKVPAWYIESCKKIKYMFPKAHAAAYVLMAVRIAWFKVHFPILYYAAYFTVRAADFDLLAMVQGPQMIRAKIDEIESKGLEASTKEKNLLTVLELALEMCERGMRFQTVDLYRSEASEFIIEGNTLIPPFDAIPGLGTNVAKMIVEARKDGEFLSKEDLQQRGRVSKTIIEYLDQLGSLGDMPDSNQLSLF